MSGKPSQRPLTGFGFVLPPKRATQQSQEVPPVISQDLEQEASTSDQAAVVDLSEPQASVAELAAAAPEPPAVTAAAAAQTEVTDTTAASGDNCGDHRWQ